MGIFPDFFFSFFSCLLAFLRLSELNMIEKNPISKRNKVPMSRLSTVLQYSVHYLAIKVSELSLGLKNFFGSICTVVAGARRGSWYLSSSSMDRLGLGMSKGSTASGILSLSAMVFYTVECGLDFFFLPLLQIPVMARSNLI